MNISKLITNNTLFNGVYFGKCDKNGKHILEGQTLRFKSHPYGEREFIGIVAYNAISCSFRIERGCDMGFNFQDIYDIEIMEGDQFSNVGFDEDGKLLGNCNICGARGTIIERHKCVCENPESIL